MPHSSGGGSHSGGGHSGGGSGGGGSLGPRTSHHHFRNARTFVYYRHNRPYYVYSDSNLRCEKPNTVAATLISIFLLIFIIPITLAMIGYFKAPTPLQNTESYNIKIADTLGILGDKTQLYASLSEFKEKTGITPAIVTVDNSKWQTKYSSLENYAYDLYVNNFEDETHWLIVYSEPSTPDDSFNDWYWEGMQGDDTDSILSSKNLSYFNKNLQKYLTASSLYTTNEAFTKAFSEFNLIVMDYNVNDYIPEILLLAVLDLAAVVGIIVIIKKAFFQGYENEELCEVKTPGSKQHTPDTEVCRYCNGVYVSGIHNNCPHCGASLSNDF